MKLFQKKEDEDRRPFGIDISGYQCSLARDVTGKIVMRKSNVNWDLLVSSGISFVFIKISEGSTIDSMAAVHIADAIAHGVPWGGYHYYLPNLTGAYQAKVAAAFLKDYRPILPNVLDMECEIGENQKAIAQSCRSFHETMGGLTNHPGMNYTRKSWLYQLRMGNADLRWMNGFGLWLAEYHFEAKPDFKQNIGSYRELASKEPFPSLPASWGITKETDVYQWTGHGTQPCHPGDVDENFARPGFLPEAPKPTTPADTGAVFVTLEDRVKRLEEEARSKGWNV